jgi:hypothetical protein
MNSISMAAAAAKSRVNSPRMSEMPANVSIQAEAQNQKKGGVKPRSAKPLSIASLGPFRSFG